MNWLDKFLMKIAVAKAAARSGMPPEHVVFSLLDAFDLINSADKAALYVRRILRNRLSYVNHAVALTLINDAVSAGYDIEQIESYAKEVRNWTEFRFEMERIINGAR